MTNDVAVRERAEVGSLYDRNTFNVSATDIALPRVYICQPLTKAVQDEIARPGDVIVAAGPEDPDAEIVYSSKTGGEGLLFHVLRLDLGKSYAKPGEPLQTWQYNDPSAHPDSWTTYTYTLALPEVDADIPHKLLLTRSNARTAKRINLVLAKAVQHGNLYDIAFRLTTEAKQNDKGKWHVAVVKIAEPTEDGLTISESLSDMVNTDNTPSARPAVAEEAPAI